MPFAPEHDPREARELFTFEALEEAWRECRRRKRSSVNTLRFELDLERNLLDLARELQEGTYHPRRSVCFVTTRPKFREIVAADFRDRVVHHFLVSRLEPIFEPRFSRDSYASRKGKGTHAAVERLGVFVRKVTRNHTRRAWYAHLDLRSFFLSIDRSILHALVARRVASATLRWLAALLIFHDPTRGAIWKGDPALRARLPRGKSLWTNPPGRGLPIGNHTSQFFANVYLDELDQHVKRCLGAPYYLRYVDDLVLLSPSRRELEGYREEIARFARERLRLELNERRSRIAPLSSGIDFLGYVSHPRHRLVRRRVVGNLRERLARFEGELVRSWLGYRWLLYREGTSERLEAVLASYGAIFARADTFGLRHSLAREFPWVLDVRAPGARKPFWRAPPGQGTLAVQVHAFHRMFPGALVALEVGPFLELYGSMAAVGRRLLGLKVYRGRRGGMRGWTRWPTARAATLLEAARRHGIERIVLVGEEPPPGPARVLSRRAVAVGRRAASRPAAAREIERCGGRAARARERRLSERRQRREPRGVEP